MSAVIQRHMLPERRWQRSQPNRELTTEMDALAHEILGLPAESRAVALECREDVCQVDLDRQTFPSPNDWKALFTPEWRRRAQGPMSVGGWRAYVTIVPLKPGGTRKRVHSAGTPAKRPPGIMRSRPSFSSRTL
jgi:hypothetical protein